MIDLLPAHTLSSSVPASNAEFSLIDWIRKRVRSADGDGLECGIGDDAAVARLDAHLVLATDMLMEGTHFRFPAATPDLAGRKALAVNLSDMAAMAARPRMALVSIAIPRDRGRKFAESVMHGIHTLADEFDVTIIGGDTNSWDGPLVLNVAVVGEVVNSAVYRSGAQSGDWIMTTGCFGGSITDHHLTFQPRVEEALRINEAVRIHAMIDVSDGLAADLHHILDESNVGAVVDAAAIPIRETVRDQNSRTPLEQAMSDGEDFELLFTVSPVDGRKLLENPPTTVSITHIGEIVETGRREMLVDDVRSPLPRTGWEHSFGDSVRQAAGKTLGTSGK
jgi:thiamine-monophosphate kinase